MKNRLVNAIALVLLIVIASSCKGLKLTKESVKETEKISYTDTTFHGKVFVPEKKISFDGSFEKQAKLIFLPGQEKKIVITKDDPVSKMKAKLTIDSLGRYNLEAISQSDSLAYELKAKNKEIVRTKETIKEFEKRETFFGKVIRYLTIGASILVVLIIVILGFYFRLRKKLPV